MSETGMELVDIGERSLATWCTGAGSPAVVLETGLGAPASDWEPIQDAISSITRVCRYDRANCGASDPAETPRDAEAMAGDLHSLVAALSLETPLVLVGHSFGAPICLTYAARWPDEVAALVLLDPTHPDQFTTFGPMMPDFLGAMKEFWTTGWRTPEGTAERIDFHSSFATVKDIVSLGDIRMMVLTSGTWRPFGSEEPHELWVRMHQDYVGLSGNSEQRVLPEADHFLQRSAPDAVIEAITDVVNEYVAGNG